MHTFIRQKLYLGLLILVIIGSSTSIYAQGSAISSSNSFSSEPNSDYYTPPLKRALNLSGSYGELRATHFHAGVDMRVGGVVGEAIYAAASGYISRIVVSPTGYGHAIYIDHPNGQTTVYGHMLRFAPHIAAYVRERQYAQNSFAVNLFPPKSKFPIKQGEEIGKVGNTGSSGGPHLHFEVRDSGTSTPLNPLKESNFTLLDNIAPQFRSVGFYGLERSSSRDEWRRWRIARYNAPYNQVITLPSNFYIAVDGIDKQNETPAKLAVYNYRYYLDDTLIFSFHPANIPFNRGRYINSVVEYSERINNNLSMVKSFVEPGNALKNNITAKDGGVFKLKDSLIHSVKIELEDEHGNVSTRRFKVKRGDVSPPWVDSSNNFQALDSLKNNRKLWVWHISNRYQDSLIKVTIPAAALFSSTPFLIERLSDNLFRVGDHQVPFLSNIILALKIPDELKLHDPKKLAIAKVGPKGNLSFAGGSVSDGWIETRVNTFGKYKVVLDTISPTVTTSIEDGQDLSGKESIIFKIKDEFSGIASYKVTIDGKWVLSAYDPKSRSLRSELRSDKIESGNRKRLEVEVVDNRGNRSSFFWYIKINF